MSNIHLRNLTNHFQDFRLVSLGSWRQASEFTGRDRNGPYMVTQEGYDPEDMRMTANEFVLGRSGKWLSLSHFFRLPVPDRRAEFIFNSAAEGMAMMVDLPSKAEIIRPGAAPESSAPPEQDEMAAAYQAGKGQSPKPPA